MSTEASGGAPNQAVTPVDMVGASTPRTATPPVRSGKVAWIVIGLSMLVGAVLGVFVYIRAANGSLEIANDYKDMRARGATMSADECVATGIDWFNNRCGAVGKMCIDAVPRIVGECLAAKDRSEACLANGNDLKSSQWAYQHCAQMGIDKKSKKPVKESCTLAWRAFDSWCKSGQTGVAL
jgi:hypothetical protein